VHSGPTFLWAKILVHLSRCGERQKFGTFIPAAPKFPKIPKKLEFSVMTQGCRNSIQPLLSGCVHSPLPQAVLFLGAFLADISLGQNFGTFSRPRQNFGDIFLRQKFGTFVPVGSLFFKDDVYSME
jgi:hypothetical protein